VRRLLSTTASATGLGGIGRVKLFEPPHMTSNYLTREMGFQVARKHARKLRMIALMLGCVLPILLLLIALGLLGAVATALALLAVAAFYAGILTERWLFFAEARHAVTSYYGR
jgi:DMSO reductase anchor subunit